MGAKLEIF